MKYTLLTIGFIIGVSLISKGQGPSGAPPASNTNVSLMSGSSWYRGGNVPFGTAGINNIFGTMWNSGIYLYTNSRNIGQFSSNNILHGLIGNGDGLRINNMDPQILPGSDLGQIDIFTSASNSTEIRFGGSGNILGGFNRFEIHGNYQGIFVNAREGGNLEFARIGLVNGFVGANNYWRIGIQSDAANISANRRLEVVDNTTQFRLTYGGQNGGPMTDFLSNTFGNLQIMPQGGKVGINLSSNPTEGIDVEGNGRIRQLPIASNMAPLGVDKVVMVDANGVLRWKDISTFGSISTASNGAWINNNNEVEWGTNILQHNTQTPMGAYKVLFQTGQNSNNSVSIGGSTFNPNARLYIDNDNLGTGELIRSYSWNGVQIANRSGLSAYGYDAIFLSGVYGFAKSGDQVQGVYGTAYNGAKTTIGVRGSASSTNINSTNMGADFTASGGSVYENVGVRGYSDGSVKTNFGGKFKAGSSGTLSIGVYAEGTSNGVNTAYAAYWSGGVVTTGGSLWTGSDSALKDSIENLTNVDSIIMAIQPVSFEYKQTGNAARLNLPTSERFGVIAQQVETVIPSMVQLAHHPAEYDSLGNEIAPAFSYKVVDMNQLVPLMLSDIQKKTVTINEQSQQIQGMGLIIDSMETIVTDLNDRLTLLENCLSGILPLLCQMNNSTIQPTQESVQEQLRTAINVNLSNRNNIILNQNVPNPFAESTIITFSIPSSVQKAQIQFYDGQGKLINTVDILERGNGQLNVFANDLSTGVYTYSLVADGQIISTKRMMKE